MKTYIYIIAILMTFNIAKAQEIRFVNADNGLFLRDKPSQNSKRIDKLVYGTQLEITHKTNLKMDVQDNNKVITGEWVKVSCTDDIHNPRTGYVFNGFLTEKKLEKRFRVGFEDFTMEFENLNAEVIDNPQASTHESDNVDALIDIGESVENKTLRIRHHSKYKSIEVFQKHQNSISIMNEGPHCDLSDWKHYYSSWTPLQSTPKTNVFSTIAYDENTWNKFIDVDMNEFKNAVKTHCGDEWHKLIKDAENINSKTSEVSISKVFFKVVFTTLHDEKIEKIIAFNIPMGC